MKQKHIVILGGGFGGVECLRRLNSFSRDDIHITLINRNNYSLFTPMLHEVATGSVSRETIVQPLREMIACCHNRCMEAEIKKIDLVKKVVKTSVKDVHFDYVVIALGGKAHFFDCPGAEDCALPLKTMQDAINVRNHLIAQFERAAVCENKKERDDRMRFVVVGGGLTGVELAGQLADLCVEMRELYPEIPDAEPEIILVHGSDRILPQLAPISSKRAHHILTQKKVKIMLNSFATQVKKHEVHITNHEPIKTYTTLWTSGIESSLVGLMDKNVLNARSQLSVDNTLRVKTYPYAFGIGDCCDIEDAKTPATAQAATQAGRLAADNLIAMIDGRDMRAFRFKSKGDLVPIGEWNGIAEIGVLKFSGKFAWWLRRTVFLQRVWSWTNRVKVALEWTINMVRPRDTSQL